MRVIKFRAQRIDNGRWAYGYYVKTPITTEFNADGQFLDSGLGRHCIVQDGVAHEIDIKTVGEFTGLHDKNGREIYEGDILNEKHDKAAQGGGWIAGTNGFHPENALVVEWSEASAKFTVDFGAKGLAKELSWRKQWGGLEVIGNIHENPNLIKESK